MTIFPPIVDGIHSAAVGVATSPSLVGRLRGRPVYIILAAPLVGLVVVLGLIYVYAKYAFQHRVAQRLALRRVRPPANRAPVPSLPELDQIRAEGLAGDALGQRLFEVLVRLYPPYPETVFVRKYAREGLLYDFRLREFQHQDSYFSDSYMRLLSHAEFRCLRSYANSLDRSNVYYRGLYRIKCRLVFDDREIKRVLPLIDVAFSDPFNPSDDADIEGAFPEIQGAYNGLHVALQGHIGNSIAACAYMMILDRGVTIKVNQFLKLMDYIEPDGRAIEPLKHQYRILAFLAGFELEGFVKKVANLDELKMAIVSHGSACVPIYGHHYVIVDGIETKGIWLRDPYHGWAIGVTEEAFLKHWNSSQEIVQFKSWRAKSARPQNPMGA